MAGLKFIKCNSTDITAQYLADKINYHLRQNHNVTWFLSGGSAITVAVTAGPMIQQPANNLSITLIDERYGEPGHENSNWQQLESAGFNVKGANLEPVLNGKNREETTEMFNAVLAEIFRKSTYTIGLLGLGPDGHIAGLLPHSSPLNSGQLADYYRGPDFDRITLTPKALLQLDEAVVWVQGADKQFALQKLDDSLKIDDQPAQLLKKMPRVTIFNDYKGEKI